MEKSNSPEEEHNYAYPCLYSYSEAVTLRVKQEQFPPAKSQMSLNGVTNSPVDTDFSSPGRLC